MNEATRRLAKRSAIITAVAFVMIISMWGLSHFTEPMPPRKEFSKTNPCGNYVAIRGVYDQVVCVQGYVP